MLLPSTHISHTSPCLGLCSGSPGSPVEMSITKSTSALTLHWAPGDTGSGALTGYVIEARPSGRTSMHTPL